jgi:hypothetical protein
MIRRDAIAGVDDFGAETAARAQWRKTRKT